MIDYLKNKTMCIVGNSPCELNKSNGKFIDSHDVVIRFNDYSLNFQKDYGKKVNIWVRATNDDVISTLQEKNLKAHDKIVIRASNKNNQKSIDFYNKCGYDYLILPIEYEVELSKKIKAIPSTGLLFLFYLKENKINMVESNIFGFSFFEKKELSVYKTNHYYNSISLEKSSGIGLSRHKWDIEKVYFNKEILCK